MNPKDVNKAIKKNIVESMKICFISQVVLDLQKYYKTILNKTCHCAPSPQQLQFLQL